MVYIIRITSADLQVDFLGRDGGFIIIPAITNLLKVDEYKARGTTLATIFVSLLITAIFYSSNQYFDTNISIYIAIGGAIGGYIGAKLLKNFSKNILEIVFDIFLIYIAIKMIAN